jgi:hypothetical protein
MNTTEKTIQFCRMGILPPAHVLFRNVAITGLVSGLSAGHTDAHAAPEQWQSSRVLTAKFFL